MGTANTEIRRRSGGIRVETERSRLAVAAARNARRLRMPGFLADLEARAGLKVHEDDVVDGEWAVRAVLRSLDTFHAMMAGEVAALRALRDFEAVNTGDRATAEDAVARAVPAVSPVLLCVEPSGLYMTASAPQVAARGGDWWVSLANRDEDVVVAMSADGSAGVLLDEDTYSGHLPRRWTIAYWIPR